MFAGAFETCGNSEKLAFGPLRVQHDYVGYVRSTLVIVPVLSSTTVSTCCKRSSASPPLNNRPNSAPRPVATITAVGTASPIAHGHAMIRTEIAAATA